MCYRKWLPSLTLLAALIGCDSGPKITTNNASLGGVQPAPFNGETYRTRSGGSVITLISRDELEYTNNGTIFLCKYTERNEALRVILTAMGTQQVLYFRRAPNGMISNDGTVYLSASGLAEVQRMEEQSRLDQQAAQETAERQRVEMLRQEALVAQRQADERRLADGRARKEAPEKLRLLLLTNPEVSGRSSRGSFTLKITSFDPTTAKVNAQVHFQGLYTSFSSSQAVGNIAGDILDITAHWTQKSFLGEESHGVVRLKLRFDGLDRKLVGSSSWGENESETDEITFDLK